MSSDQYLPSFHLRAFKDSSQKGQLGKNPTTWNIKPKLEQPVNIIIYQILNYLIKKTFIYERNRNCKKRNQASFEELFGCSNLSSKLGYFTVLVIEFLIAKSKKL